MDQLGGKKGLKLDTKITPLRFGGLGSGSTIVRRVNRNFALEYFEFLTLSNLFKLN